MIYAAAMVAIAITMTLALIRAALGPTTFDRILALNMFGTKTVLLIAVASFLLGRPDVIDLALVYALMNFIGVIAVLRFWKLHTFADEGSSSSGPAPAGPGAGAGAYDAMDDEEEEP